MARKRKSEMTIQVKAESPLIPVSDEGNQREDSIATRSQTKRARLDDNSQHEADAAEEQSQSNLAAEPSSSEDIQMIDQPPAAKEIQEVQDDYPSPVSPSAQSANKAAGKYTKHEAYWLLDGNILVQIGEVRFKLHRSTLVKHSQWFRNIIENDEAHNRCIFVDEETGSAVYCLDSLDIDIHDFVTLLDAMDNAISFVHDKQHPKTIAAILRAADALDFTRFKAFAVSELEKAWPSKLDKVKLQRIPYAADTVLLARRHNIKSILKRALYELVRAPGFQQMTDPDTKEDNNDGDTLTLSKSDISLLLGVREELVNFWIQKAFPPFLSQCLSPPDSSASLRCAVPGFTYIVYRTLINDSKVFSDYKYDPICGLDVLLDAPWVRGEKWSSRRKKLPTIEDRNLCSLCAKQWRDTWIKEQVKLWDDLDTWFELNDEEDRPDDPGKE